MKINEFDSILPFKIQDLVSLIIEIKNINFEEAVQFLYESKLYEALSDEQTKLWHLSSEKLLDMLLIEETTGTLIFPDFV
jgi:hypothetical protein